MTDIIRQTLRNSKRPRQISYDVETIALIRGLKDLFTVYVNEQGKINKNVVEEIMDCTDLNSLNNQLLQAYLSTISLSRKFLMNRIYTRDMKIYP